MINFFRKKRKSLAEENKAVKYTRYAIGEIILVVIGILIALSINNWNNTRIKDNDAESLSIRLLAEANKNKNNLDQQTIRVLEIQKETESLLSLFGPDYKINDPKLLDSLLFSVISTPLYDTFNSATLDEALNTGQVSILQSDSLRNNLYAIPQNIISIRNYEEELTRDIENNLIPYLYNEISLRQMDERFSENLEALGKSKLERFDNRVILSKKKFENMVNNKYFLTETLLFGYSDLSALFNETIKYLEKVLNK